MKKSFLDSGQLKKVGINEKPDFTFPSGSSYFSATGNLIPNISSTSMGRTLLGAKSAIQSIPLIHREAPLVQSIPQKGTMSFEEFYGKELAALKSPVAGTVSSTSDDAIHIKDAKGEEHKLEIYNNFNSGRKSFLHQTSIVKEGDEVKKDQVIATSNFTDDKGNLALGTNLITAVMPYRSNNFEDSFVVTESGANKLVAEQVATVRVEKRMGIETNKDKYVSLFPNKFYNQQLDTLDDAGVVKEGTTLKYGDPIILAFAPKTLKTTDIHLGKLSKALSHAHKDMSEMWEYEHEGKVIDVHNTDQLISVNIKTVRSMEVGDKISQPWGAKGICGRILADTEAPTLPNGKPVDLILNSMSVTSRVAPAIITNIALGKVAQKLGKPIKITPFVNGSSVELAKKLLEKHGIKDTEQLYDPVSGHHVEVMTGPLYINRLVHIAEDKISGRSQGVGYSSDLQPTKAGDECLTPDHEVLTTKGWKYINTLNNKDVVYSIVDNNIELSKVTGLNEHDFDGNLYSVNTQTVKFKATPNHKLYTKTRDIKTYSLKPVSELCNKYRYILKNNGNWNGAFDFSLSDYLNGLLVQSGAGRKFTKISLSNRAILFMLGAYLGDGNSIWHEKSGSYGIEICQKKAKTDRKLKKYLDALKIPYYFNRTTSKYVINSKIVATFVRQLGHALEKFIPSWLFNFSKKELRALFNGLMLTDGGQTGKQYFTSSKQLAGDFQRLCLLLGYGSNVSFRAGGHEVKFPNGYTSIAHDSYVIYILKQKNEPEINRNRGVSYIPYTGKVYCPTLDKNHTFYVRLNGSSHWTGNSSKRLGNLSTTALLSHYVPAVLRDIGTVRATKNDEFWRRLKLGLPAPAPQVPFIFNKFIAHLRGAGINVDKKDDVFQILPQTDKDTEALSTGPIDDALTFKVKHEQLIPEKGGLFDPNKVGIMGDRYNHIDLNMPIPNPISEDLIRRLLKLTVQKYEEEVVNGEVERKLKAVDVDKKIEEYKNYLRAGKVSERDNAAKVLAFLNMLKQNQLHPMDLVLHKIPVIPAMYRPAQFTGDMVLEANANKLYKDLILSNKTLKDLPEDLPPEVKSKAKAQVYQAVKAVYGLADPISTKNKEKNVKGLLAEMLGVHGGSAKGSTFQANVVNKPLDLIARGVANGDVRLDLDNISIPQDIAWKVYSPFLIRRLVQRGVPATQALEYVKNQNPLAVHALHEEMRDRPVIMSRDPALHKFNLMGFMPKINPDPKNKTISVNPLVFKVFNLDLDGDQVNVGVPASTDAKEEIKDKMLPSSNLLTVRNFSPSFVPSNESALGLFQSSTEDNKNVPKEFKTEEDVIKAFNAGHLKVGDRVKVAK